MSAPPPEQTAGLDKTEQLGFNLVL